MREKKTTPSQAAEGPSGFGGSQTSLPAPTAQATGDRGQNRVLALLTAWKSHGRAPVEEKKFTFPHSFGEIVRQAVARIIRGLALREGNLFLLLAVVIGLASGLLVVCFRIAIEGARLWFFGSSLTASPLRVLLIPAVVGLVIAACIMLLFRGVRGSGVNQTKAAVYIYDGYIPFRTVIGKFVLCALAIGSGQSLGPEDPSLQIGAGIASALGRRLRLSREKIRLIAPVGAAAGLAAAFNAPISATIFVIEEVIGNWNAGVLGAIVLSAVSSVIVSRWFLGDQALFGIPAYHLVHPAELLVYALLGVIGGVFSLAFVKLVA